ncbi:hypothetical protein KJ855_03820 [Patescibacteria group bacterium]|nr:hypothetical protein [Patescibacteria group bacterium]
MSLDKKQLRGNPDKDNWQEVMREYAGQVLPGMVRLLEEYQPICYAEEIKKQENRLNGLQSHLEVMERKDEVGRLKSSLDEKRTMKELYQLQRDDSRDNYQKRKNSLLAEQEEYDQLLDDLHEEFVGTNDGIEKLKDRIGDFSEKISGVLVDLDGSKENIERKGSPIVDLYASGKAEIDFSKCEVRDHRKLERLEELAAYFERYRPFYEGAKGFFDNPENLASENLEDPMNIFRLRCVLNVTYDMMERMAEYSNLICDLYIGPHREKIIKENPMLADTLNSFFDSVEQVRDKLHPNKDFYSLAQMSTAEILKKEENILSDKITFDQKEQELEIGVKGIERQMDKTLKKLSDKLKEKEKIVDILKEVKVQKKKGLLDRMIEFEYKKKNLYKRQRARIEEQINHDDAGAYLADRREKKDKEGMEYGLNGYNLHVWLRQEGRDSVLADELEAMEGFAKKTIGMIQKNVTYLVYSQMNYNQEDRPEVLREMTSSIEVMINIYMVVMKGIGEKVRNCDEKIKPTNPDGKLSEMLYVMSLKAAWYKESQRRGNKDLYKEQRYEFAPEEMEGKKWDMVIERGENDDVERCPVQLTVIDKYFIDRSNGERFVTNELRKDYLEKQRDAWQFGVPLVWIGNCKDNFNNIKFIKYASDGFLEKKLYSQLKDQYNLTDEQGVRTNMDWVMKIIE